MTLMKKVIEEVDDFYFELINEWEFEADESELSFKDSADLNKFLHSIKDILIKSTIKLVSFPLKYDGDSIYFVADVTEKELEKKLTFEELIKYDFYNIEFFNLKFTDEDGANYKINRKMFFNSKGEL